MNFNVLSVSVEIINFFIVIIVIIIFIKLIQFLSNYKKDLGTINSKLDELLKKLK